MNNQKIPATIDDITVNLSAENETVTLLPKTTKIVDSLKLISYTVNNTFFAITLDTVARLISKIQPASGGLCLTIMSLDFAAVRGFCLAVGIDLGGFIREKDYVNASRSARVGTLCAIVVGLGGAIIMLGTGEILPFIFSDKVASVATMFLRGASISLVPLAIMTNDLQLALNVGQWFISTVAGGLMLITSAGGAYLLGPVAKLGSFGAGLGLSLGTILACVTNRFFFCTKPFQVLKMDGGIPDIPQKLKKAFFEGSQLSAQRLTEWLNLFIIENLLALTGDSEGLTAIVPIFGVFRLLGSILQGFSQALAVLIKSKESPDDIYDILRRAFGITLLGSGSAVLLSYFFGSELTQFFLGDITLPIQELSKTLLWTGTLGFIPDAVRLLLIGMLRAVKDFTFPMVVSFLTMNILSPLAGWGLHELLSSLFGDSPNIVNGSTCQIITRGLCALIADGILAWRFWGKLPALLQKPLQSTEEIPENSIPRTSINSSSFSYGSFFKALKNDSQETSEVSFAASSRCTIL